MGFKIHPFLCWEKDPSVFCVSRCDTFTSQHDIQSEPESVERCAVMGKWTLQWWRSEMAAWINKWHFRRWQQIHAYEAFCLCTQTPPKISSNELCPDNSTATFTSRRKGFANISVVCQLNKVSFTNYFLKM